MKHKRPELPRSTAAVDAACKLDKHRESAAVRRKALVVTRVCSALRILARPTGGDGFPSSGVRKTIRQFPEEVQPKAHTPKRQQIVTGHRRESNQQDSRQCQASRPVHISIRYPSLLVSFLTERRGILKAFGQSLGGAGLEAGHLLTWEWYRQRQNKVLTVKRYSGDRWAECPSVRSKNSESLIL